MVRRPAPQVNVRGVRSKLGLPDLLPDSLDGFRYSTFLNLVTNGEYNPFSAWCRENPRLYLDG